MGKSLNNILVTIGGPESSPGTPESRTHVLPITGLPGFRETPDKAEDPAIIGRNMAAGEYLMAKDLSGGIPITPRCCGGFGKLLNSLFGQEGTPAQIGGLIRVCYGGAEDSCKIVASASGDTLASNVGDLGSESGDSNFGTAGVIDLTDPATDTLDELIAVIDAYSDYECEKIFEDTTTAVDAADIIDITYSQGNEKWVYIWFGSSTSGVYLHKWEVDLTNTERPHYSLQIDNVHDNFLDAGVVIDGLSLSGAIKGMIEGAVDNAIGMSRTGSQSPSSETLEDVDPLRYSDGGFALGGNDYNFIRNFNIKFSNNCDSEGFGQGSLSRQYIEKGKFTCEGDFSFRFDSNMVTERAKVFNNSRVALSTYYKAKDLVAGIPEFMLIELPHLQLSDYQESDNGGKVDGQINFKAVYPKGTVYDAPVTVCILTTDSGAY